VIEPIRLHVDAKRALCALEPAYHDALSEDSKRSLQLQGGIFTAEQMQAFMAKPHGRRRRSRAPLGRPGEDGPARPSPAATFSRDGGSAAR
jgi:hypothetical protein